MIGTLFVDETPFDIVDIRLETGRLWFKARRLGPMPHGEVTHMWRVHAPDGTVVLQAIVEVTWPRPASVDGYTWIDLPVAIDGARPGEAMPTNTGVGT